MLEIFRALSMVLLSNIKTFDSTDTSMCHFLFCLMILPTHTSKIYQAMIILLGNCSETIKENQSAKSIKFFTK